MNKYRDKSDFEINKSVAKRYLTHDFRLNSIDEIVELIDVDLYREYGGEINLANKYVIGKFSPCNNPADAMPIIIENGISLINSDGVHFAAAPGCGIEGYLGGDTVGYGSRKYSENENIYRAAMEVFLMMKDAENES
ncbi:phage protein NinX family protein [Morganella morganii]